MTRPLRIIHAADLHLDSPFEALGEKAALRRSEQRRLLGRIADEVRRRNADMLLLAGDLLDSTAAFAETSAMLRETFAALDCPVFIAPGNHDHYCAASPYAREVFPENVHIFRGGMECVELPELGVRVWGAAFTDVSAPPMLRSYRVPDGDAINVCVLHGDLDAPDSRYCPIKSADLEQSGLDYLALGHVHSFSGLMRFGSTFCAYPGCAEGRGFDECGEKGILYVELEKGRCTAEFVPTCFRRYMVIEADAENAAAAIPDGTGEHICRLILTGETDSAPDLAALEAELSPRFFALQLRDKTTLRRDIWEHASRDSLKGIFLRKMRDMYDGAATEDERELVIKAVRWGLAALEGGEAVESI